MSTILVTGGAGYIGAHTCLALAEAGHRPVTYDNLSKGHADAVRWGPLERGDLRDRDRLRAVFHLHRPEAVIHFAGLSEVGESMRDPLGYFDANLSGALALLDCAREAGVDKLVFSSTCAVYGPCDAPILAETTPLAPCSPYGRSKLMIEHVLEELGSLAGLRSIRLRYFNAAGADPEGRIGERHDPETHAIPLAIEAALGRRPSFTVYGDDYCTPDGSAVRDYIHVLDLADAHVIAVERLLGGGPSGVFNLGTGRGISVLDMLDMVAKIAGRPVPASVCGRRPGDAPSLVADSRRARLELGWRHRRTFRTIVQTAFDWHRAQGLPVPAPSRVMEIS